MGQSEKPDKVQISANPQDILSALIQNDLRFEITIAALTQTLIDKKIVTEKELQKTTEEVIADTKKKASAILTPTKPGLILPPGSSTKH